MHIYEQIDIHTVLLCVLMCVCVCVCVKLRFCMLFNVIIISVLNTYSSKEIISSAENNKYTKLYTCVCVCVYCMCKGISYTKTHTHTQTHSHTYIYIHTNTHTRTTHTPSFLFLAFLGMFVLSPSPTMCTVSVHS